MTLCIAALCEEGDKGRMVIGTDWRVSGEISAGADIQDKLLWVNDDILMLLSGEVTRARQLRDAYREVLAGMAARNPTPEALSSVNIRRFIGAGAKRFKAQLAEEIVSFATGLTYDKFRAAVANKEIPESVATPIYQKIERQGFEADVLMLVFVDDLQYIFVVEKSGHFLECDNFGIVGDGTYVAEALMYLRKHESTQSLSETVYHIYEAMFMAARCVGDVGGTHTINVLYPPGERKKTVSIDELSKDGFKFMREKFVNRFGIRRIGYFPKLPNESLEVDDEEADMESSPSYRERARD
jgi:hypothetical protein